MQVKDQQGTPSSKYHAWRTIILWLQQDYNKNNILFSFAFDFRKHGQSIGWCDVFNLCRIIFLDYLEYSIAIFVIIGTRSSEHGFDTISSQDNISRVFILLFDFKE